MRPPAEDPDALVEAIARRGRGEDFDSSTAHSPPGSFVLADGVNLATKVGAGCCGLALALGASVLQSFSPGGVSGQNFK
jgi:hypothetical protein